MIILLKDIHENYTRLLTEQTETLGEISNNLLSDQTVTLYG
jgi:hypothetical protein